MNVEIVLGWFNMAIFLARIVFNTLLSIVFARKKFAKTAFQVYSCAFGVFSLNLPLQFVNTNFNIGLSTMSPLCCKLNNYTVFALDSTSSWILVGLST